MLKMPKLILIQLYNIITCVTHAEPEKQILNFDCINYDKFNQLITGLHERHEKKVLKVVEGDRSPITYLIQKNKIQSS